MEDRPDFKIEQKEYNKKYLTSYNVVKFILLITIVCVTIATYFYLQQDKQSLGNRAVMYMYDFDSIEDLGEQMIDLEKITTATTFNKIAANNSDKALNTYLKFKQSAVNVEILSEDSSSTGGYVLYTLHTDSISAGRKFAFIYEIDGGKISYAREMECIDFYEGE